MEKPVLFRRCCRYVYVQKKKERDENSFTDILEELDNLSKRFTVGIEHVKKLVEDQQSSDTNKTQIINEDSITLSMNGKSVICANGIELISREQNELGFDILVILIENHMKNFFSMHDNYVMPNEIARSLNRKGTKRITEKNVKTTIHRVRRLFSEICRIDFTVIDNFRWQGYKLSSKIQLGFAQK